MVTKEEVITRIKSHVQHDFNGDYKKAFNKYSKGTDYVNREGVVDLLYYSNVGYALTRGMIADEILKVMDKDDKGSISWDEFSEAIKRENNNG